MNHLTNEAEMVFDLISQSDVQALSSSKMMLRDRFGGFLHVEATQLSEVCEVYVVNKDCPPPLYYFLHYGVILSNNFCIGSIYPRTYSYMLIHALRYEDKMKYQLFFTNSLESAKRKACIMEGHVRVSKFKSASTSSNAFRWLDVLKKYIGRKISSNGDLAVTCLTAVKEFYAVMNDKNAERLGKNTEKAMQTTIDEFCVSPHAPTASLSDRTFIEFVEKFIEHSTKFADLEVV
jgi:hypothetical protein